MADTKFSALSAVTTPASTDELAVNQAGTSKKMTLAQLRQSQGTTPTVVSVGTEFTSVNAPTATLPGTHAANDILLLILQTSNQAHATAPTGYKQLGPQNGIGSPIVAGCTRLIIFWKRDGGSESAPTILDTGDHTYGVMIAIRGAPTTGDPYRMIGQAWKHTGSTTGTADSGTTRTPNSLILNIFAHGIDQTISAGSALTNASLTSLTEQFDDSTSDGTGGGIYVASGIMATPGAVSATTVTWNATTVDVSTTIAFPPADSFPMPRGPETYSFLGSAAGSDDNFSAPDGSRKFFVQTVDGGGGGSGGNTTTTAAGGGGGGGGGYDEAWYEAEDFVLTNPITVHAGAGGAGGTNNNPGVNGELSFFESSTGGPLGSVSGTHTTRMVGVAATAAASADGGNGGCGSGTKGATLTVNTTRTEMNALGAANLMPAIGRGGGRGGSGTTAPVGGSPADWGGGGGESGGDTDAAIAAGASGYSLRGGGGGSGGRTNTIISVPGSGGGAVATSSAQGAAGADSTKLPYGGAGGVGGGSSVNAGGRGGVPGGGGGGGGGTASGTGGRGGDGLVMVTVIF